MPAVLLPDPNERTALPWKHEEQQCANPGGVSIIVHYQILRICVALKVLKVDKVSMSAKLKCSLKCGECPKDSSYMKLELIHSHNLELSYVLIEIKMSQYH